MNNNNMLQNNLAKYFLKNINHFIKNEEMLKEFLQVVNSNIPLYYLIKYENINKNIKFLDFIKLDNINLDVIKYPPYFLKLLSKNTILKYADKFYEEAYTYLIDFINKNNCLYNAEIENYFLYNAIKNNINNIIIDDNFIKQNYMSYIQIHKNSPTPLSKEIFTKLIKSPDLISYLLKYKIIKKNIIHPDTLFILQVIAYFDYYCNRIQSKLPKNVKNFCKTVNKEDLYDLMFN